MWAGKRVCLDQTGRDYSYPKEDVGLLCLYEPNIWTSEFPALLVNWKKKKKRKEQPWFRIMGIVCSTWLLTMQIFYVQKPIRLLFSKYQLFSKLSTGLSNCSSLKHWHVWFTIKCGFICPERSSLLYWIRFVFISNLLMEAFFIRVGWTRFTTTIQKPTMRLWHIQSLFDWRVPP